MTRFIAEDSLEDFPRENSVNVLASERKMLDDDAGVKYSVHMLVGKP